MATVLLLVIYIAFLGIGIPDSLFGAAWPAIYADLGVPISMANCVTLIVSCGTVVSSLLSARLINKLGTAKTTAISTMMTAVALLGFSYSPNMALLCLCSVPLGLGAGAIDTALNNYVALHYKASHMSFLHCIGNVGTCISPYIMSLALAAANNWRGGYRSMFGVQLAIGLITVASLPLWKRAHSAVTAHEEELRPKTLTLAQVWRMPLVRPILCIFFCSCAVEFVCGLWGSTYLVESRGLDPSAAAKFAAIYYLGMTLGRLFSGLLASKLSSWQLIRMGLCLVLVALVLLLLPLPVGFAGAALFMVGLGNGPLFPNMTHLTPRIFGADVCQSVIGVQMTAANLGVMLAPALFGLLSQALGTGLFPWYILFFGSIFAASVLIIHKKKVVK